MRIALLGDPEAGRLVNFSGDPSGQPMGWLAVVNSTGTSLAIPNEAIRRTMTMVPGLKREVPALALGMGTAVWHVKG